jgi:predicted amidohydrolase YtcJ
MTWSFKLPIFSLLLVFHSGVATIGAQDLPAEVLRYADTVLHNGQVMTMDRDQPPITIVEAVALRDGRVLAVGGNDRILTMAGPDTLRVDLAGKTVIPGVIDTHSHPNTYALRHYQDEYLPIYLKYLEENQVRFVTVRWDSKETALADFKRVAENLPPGYWIYSTGRLVPTTLYDIKKEDLDQVVPDHPLYVMLGNAMFGLANSKMLDIVVERYGDNLTGLVKDAEGELTGQLLGAAGTVIDQEVIPNAPPEVLAPFLKRELEEWVAMGITTLSTRLQGNEISAYHQLDQDGELPLRLPYSHEIGRGNPFLERDLKRFGNLQGHGTDRMWMIGISGGIPDGTGPGTSPGAGTDCVTLEKREILPNDYWEEGMCFWDIPGDPGADAMIVANRYGYRTSGVHTFGDQAYLRVLDAYEQADKENPIAGRRFVLDHANMVSPEVVEKAAEMDITWTVQLLGLYRGSVAAVSRIYGEEYAHQWMKPVKRLIDAGMRVTYGADVHDDPDRHPMFGLELLVTRVSRDGRVFGPRERIDRANGLLMLTRWGAYYVLAEDELGSLEPGKKADLAILSQNPLDRSIPDEDLSEIEVLTTVIGGELASGAYPGQ